MTMFIRFILVLLISAFLFSCEKKVEKYSDVPPTVLSAIREHVNKNFSGDANIVETWVERQVNAYREIIKIVPEIPLSEYSKIVKYAEDVSGADYIAAFWEVDSMLDLAESFHDKSQKLSQEELKFVKSLFNDSSAIEYKARLNRALDWITAFEDMKYIERRFDVDSFNALKKKYLAENRNNPNAVMPMFYAQSRALDKLKNFYIRNVPKEVLENLKAQIAKSHPNDFITQFDVLAKTDFSKLPQEKKEVVEDAKTLSLRAQAEQVFRECVFTKRGEGDDIDVAILVKMNGKTAILCDKNFIPQKMPVVFGNSAGYITCSKAVVSEEYPLVVMFPDEEPTMFKPIEVISPKEMLDLPKKELYMIAPSGGGFTGKPVRVFSEDVHYLNFTVDDTPKTEREMKIRRLDRNADKIIIDIIDKYDVGEHAIVFEPKTRKLVSVALRYYSLGMIDMGGKTGNVLGHERMQIPDFVSFVRMFDGNVGATVYSPPSSIRFVRMTGMKGWKRLNVDKFWAQKNAIRKYTDVNNEYLQFFIRGSYEEALRSVCISKIAIKYREDFYHRNLSRESFLNRYEAFVIEVLHSMRIDMNRFGNSSVTPESIYSIYRGEIAYQMALRKAMYDYTKEYLKENKITGFIDHGWGIRLMGADARGYIGNVRRSGVRRGVNINQ